VKQVFKIEAVNLIPQIPMVVFTAQYKTQRAQIEIRIIIKKETISPTKVTRGQFVEITGKMDKLEDVASRTITTTEVEDNNNKSTSGFGTLSGGVLMKTVITLF
jgi:hypothetical protein